MLLAELQGGRRGRSGEYDRSLQRTAAIRRRFADPLPDLVGEQQR